jgi:hypothetical protein
MLVHKMRILTREETLKRGSNEMLQPYAGRVEVEN